MDSGTGSASPCLSKWEKENDIEMVSDADELFRYDDSRQRQHMREQPWKAPRFYTEVKISALALLKMAIHAHSGGKIEVMGLMQGYCRDSVMVVTNAFALPVEGTETRVNAAAQGYEYMVQYLENSKQIGRRENAIGWYHSHPGYGCWLSGIDVSTQMLNQQFQEPWLAVVIDPLRTIAAGKVEIGAFRTFPKDYKEEETHSSGYQSIPLNKIEDFGVHTSRYYPLPISFFKSSSDSSLLDCLWQKYWINTLSYSPLLVNASYGSEQLSDVSAKLEQMEQVVTDVRFGTRGNLSKAKNESLEKIAQDSVKMAVEATLGSMSLLLKDRLFNSRNQQE